MKIFKPKSAAKLLVIAALAVGVVFSAVSRAQGVAVDPAATQILQRMIDHLSGLQQFSFHTENTLEDQLASGQRIDVDVAASVTVSRPNHLLAERKGGLVSQIFYYDGKTLTLYDPDAGVYARESAPDSIEGLLNFARESLGLVVPAADLLYSNAYSLLMEGVTSAHVVGKSVIGGVSCDHLAFSRPGVDFQVWVADQGQPLPCKFVVTDTGTPARLSVVTVISDWVTETTVEEASFTFVTPEGVSQISFMRLDEVDAKQ